MRSGVPVAQAAASVRSALPDVPEVTANAQGHIGAAAVRSLWEAANALDGQRCAHLVADAVRSQGVLTAWSDLIVPVLQKAGHQWEDRQAGVDVEHVLSDAVTAGLFLDTRVKREGVLLAATATEDHVLPLYALRAALAEEGIGAELLTARTPAVALGEAAKRLHPAVVILWAQLAPNADQEGFAHLPGIRPKPAIATAGPGWSQGSPAPHLGDLTEAVNFVRSHV